MSSHVLTVKRNFAASRERVFKAFTRPESLQQWFGPTQFSVPRAEVDLRPGGRYIIEMHSPEGTVHIVTGVYREVSAPDTLSFTWAWLEGDTQGPETLVRLSFHERENDAGMETEMLMEQSGFATEAYRDLHYTGWGYSFTGLEDWLEGHCKGIDAQPVVLGAKWSSYVRSVRMTLAEKGIAFRTEAYRPHSAEILAHNPFGRIPVLLNGKDKLFEASAIMRYVDQQFPGPRLVPINVLDAALMEQWISLTTADFFPLLGHQFVLPQLQAKSGQAAELDTQLQSVRPQVEWQMNYIDQALRSQDYLVAGQITLADLMLWPILDYVFRSPASEGFDTRYVEVYRYHQTILQRSSCQLVMFDQAA